MFDAKTMFFIYNHQSQSVKSQVFTEDGMGSNNTRFGGLFLKVLLCSCCLHSGNQSHADAEVNASFHKGSMMLNGEDGCGTSNTDDFQPPLEWRPHRDFCFSKSTSPTISLFIGFSSARSVSTSSIACC